MSEHQRKFRNYLINPIVQLRLSLISLFMIFCFAISLVAVAYISLVDLFETMVELSNIQNDVRTALIAEIANFGSWLIALLFIFSILTTVVIIFESHKVVGAAYAINKFIQNKLMKRDFSSRIKLRDGDFLQDVAQSLNEFSESMETESSKPK